MTIGGGLYDNYEPTPQPEPGNAAKAREWLFWACIGFGVWSVLQVNPALFFLLFLFGGIVGGIILIGKLTLEQIRDALK